MKQMEDGRTTWHHLTSHDESTARRDIIINQRTYTSRSNLSNELRTCAPYNVLSDSKTLGACKLLCSLKKCPSKACVLK